MSGFTSSQTGKFEDYFMTTTDLIDDYAQGGMWLWGLNITGQLGTNDRIHRSSPVQTIAGGANWKVVSAGNQHVAAIKTDGTLWTWGDGLFGILGNNANVHRSSPVQTIAGGTNWKSVSAAYSYTTAIKTDGTLWTWGVNNYGQLGTNDKINRSSPIQTIAGGTNWKTCSCLTTFTGAIKTDGTLWVWGDNYAGQLGTNDRIDRSSPVQTIVGGTNWKSVACGYRHVAAIKTDGTLWVWGFNNYGQLGTNSTVHRSSPVQTIAGGTNWRFISSGYNNIAAINNDGSLWMCGYNYNGELGNNEIVHKSSPVQTIAGGTNWKFVSCSSNHIFAIKTDGTLWGWGYNNYGQLGTNDRISRSSPVQTIAGGTNWKQVSCDANFTGATQYSDISQIL